MKMLFAKMIISFKKNLNIVLDFDYTMTNFSSYSSIGVFSNYLDDDAVNLITSGNTVVEKDIDG